MFTDDLHTAIVSADHDHVTPVGGGDSTVCLFPRWATSSPGTPTTKRPRAQAHRDPHISGCIKL
jgi:hypothetical protein